KEAIEYEVSRNGQVFFIHNRVQNIQEVQLMINKLCPGVQTIVAHGQMEGPKLEKIMLDFISGNYDVLIATTIIESGLDIPNANTIIINNAQNFGLSDLHQLRGRVGRSNKKAFCYLLAPPLTAVTPEARRRLKAIEDFSELGSGFNIAMQDLDIRGAGNLLGGEQSGFIADIGFETYHQILNEAVQELREEEFSELFEEEETRIKSDDKEPVTRKQKNWVSDCTIDTDLEILFPDEYIYNVSERIKLYRELDNIENEDSLQKFAAKLEDRFGEIPPPSLELFNVVRVRWLAMRLGFEKIILKNSKLLVYFVSNQQSFYYRSNIFAGIMKYLQQHPRRFSMKEAKEKLYLSVNDIKNLEQTIKLFQNIIKEVMKQD
ncbi:MAG TPA: TRCF domain-containing protein, partial [Bacteroidales bacterium]|nr:TRCF domain-containing protein [Bacteroidales bacterium]